MSDGSAADLLAQAAGESVGAASAGIVVSADGLAVADQYAKTNNPVLYTYAKTRQSAGTTTGPPWLLIGLAGAGALLWFVMSRKGAGVSALSGYRRRRRSRR